MSNIVDILTKREYLYRELFSINNKITNLPFYFTNNPTNPLIEEIKASFLLRDPLIVNNEYSRNVHYNSLNFFNFIVLKLFFNGLNSSLNLNFLTLPILNHFFNSDTLFVEKTNLELFKNQYRPMKKGITNMIRLHATGAVAMPTEIRLQILASSKDVIHS